MSKTFSIVIPTFNSKNVAPETVQSALNQTHPNLEVIVDDNTSRDGTVNLLKSQFGHDPRMHIFENRDDLNIPRGWNRGMGRATGDLMILLHSDNLLHPDYAASVVSIADRFDADVIYTESLYFEGQTPNDLFSFGLGNPKDLPVTFLSPGARAIDYIFRYQRMIPTSSVSISRKCFAGRPPFDPQYLWDPDIELMTWLAKRFRVAHLQIPLCAIRTHEGQASSWKDPTFSQQYEKLLRFTNTEAKSEPHHFLIHWAWSNQDVCDKLCRLENVPTKTFLKYQWSWLKSEWRLFTYFTVYFMKKVRLMFRFLKVRFAN